jgi:hypothetical protein
MRVALVLALSIALSGSALAAPKASVHSLRAAEKAFYTAGLPFRTDWTPSPVNLYLVPLHKNEPPSAFFSAMPATLRRHLIGWAGGGSSLTFKTWEVWVFDQSRPALTYMKQWGQHCKVPNCKASIVRADNVVFDGSQSSAGSRALAQLRRQ